MLVNGIGMSKAKYCRIIGQAPPGGADNSDQSPMGYRRINVGFRIMWSNALITILFMLPILIGIENRDEVLLTTIQLYMAIMQVDS